MNMCAELRKFTCLAVLLVLRPFAYFEHHHVKHLHTNLSITRFVDTWTAFLTQGGKQVQPDQALDRVQEFDQLFKFAVWFSAEIWTRPVVLNLG